MDLFTYLMAKKGQNTGRDLFSYLLGKNAGGSGTYTTFFGITLNISNTVFGKIKNFMLNSTELTQDGTPSPSSPVDVNVITGSNNIKITDGVEEQNYPISLGTLEYCKIGNYADQIFKNTLDSPFYDNTLVDGDWYVKKNVDKVVLNGSENWQERTNSGGRKQFYCNTNAINVVFSNQLCNYAKFNSSVFNWSNEGDFGLLNNTRVFYLGVNNNAVLDDFKTTVNSNNINVYYPLSTPTYIHITPTDYPTLKGQLEDIYNNSKSYNGQTNITQTNDDLPFNISADVKVKEEE